MGLGTTRTLKLPMQVWDAPTRLFHWGIVVLLIVSYVSMRANAMNLHMLSGYAVLILLVFRICWGFVGSDTARFRSFLVAPGAAVRYLSRFRRDESDAPIGHNPAGGWAVMLMLLLLAIQVVSGLGSNGDEGALEGPLAGMVGKAASDRLSGIHALSFQILLWVVGLHVLAVVAYAVISRNDLVRPMITGRKRLPASARQPRIVGNGLAAVIFAAVVVVTSILLVLA